MITQIQVPLFLEERLPEIKPALQKAAGPAVNTVFTAVQCLTDFTRRMIKEHNDSMTARCLSLAGRLYIKGNDVVRTAVENIYIYSFSSLLNSCDDCKQRNKLQAAMPTGLYKAYVKQITKSGL